MLLKYCGLSGAKACKSCRSRQELSNEYFLAKFGVDTEENKPYKDWQIWQIFLKDAQYWQGTDQIGKARFKLHTILSTHHFDMVGCALNISYKEYYLYVIMSLVLTNTLYFYKTR